LSLASASSFAFNTLNIPVSSFLVTLKLFNKPLFNVPSEFLGASGSTPSFPA